MSLKSVFTKKNQVTLFMSDIEDMQKEFNKKVYLIKRLVYDRMNSLLDSLEMPNETRRAINKGLESILHMKNIVAEKAPLQELITIREVEKNDQSLIDAVVKRCAEDPTFLTKLGESIV